MVGVVPERLSPGCLRDRSDPRWRHRRSSKPSSPSCATSSLISGCRGVGDGKLLADADDPNREAYRREMPARAGHWIEARRAAKGQMVGNRRDHRVPAKTHPGPLRNFLICVRLEERVVAKHRLSRSHLMLTCRRRIKPAGYCGGYRGLEYRRRLPVTSMRAWLQRRGEQPYFRLWGSKRFAASLA